MNLIVPYCILTEWICVFTVKIKPYQLDVIFGVAKEGIGDQWSIIICQRYKLEVIIKKKKGLLV